MLEVHWRVWIEQDGKPLIGDGRARLLAAIEETGSLSAGARRIGMAYRTAWRHLGSMERGYGKKIVRRKTGGRRGGGCRLTQAGRTLLDAYVRLRRDLDELRDQCFQQFVDAT